MALVNAVRVAQLLNLSEQRVHQLVRKGMPKEGRGQFDPIKCVYFYIQYLQAAIEKRSASMSDGGCAGVREERVRLLRAAADLKEMQLARERSQLISLADYEHALADLFGTTETRIMAIPSRLAPELVGETSRVMVQAKIEKAFRQALSDLAREGSRM
jgi:phage terminase Nu1 subunit (DNA packaging protein)